jgi:2-oxoglutarate ferredoxin oxidoreductase subunit gamma
MDILVAMSQSALNKYLHRLRAGGTLIIDPELVQAPDRTDVQIAPVPATEIASELGARIAANMVMLGFLQQATGLISRDGLFDTVQTNVPQKFVELNLQAAERGIALAQEQNLTVEI